MSAEFRFEPTYTIHLDKRSTVMHAMASILVREHDVLACMANGPTGSDAVVVAEVDGPATDAQPSGGPLEDLDHGVKYDVDIPPGNMILTTITDPAQGDGSGDLGYGACVKAKPGTNLWPSIKAKELNSWDYLFHTE